MGQSAGNFVKACPVKPETRLLLFPSPVLSTQKPFFLAERTLQQLLPSQSFAEPDCSSTVGGGRFENTPVRTNDPGGSQLAAGMRKAVLDWQHPSLHPRFLPLLLLPTSFETEKLSQRDLSVEAWETRPPPSSSVHYVWPPTYHAPNTPDALVPFYQSRRERLTRMHCFQWHNFWTQFIRNLWVSKF